MSDLADKTQKFLDELEGMDLGGEEIPDEIKTLTSDSSEEDKKKADHAFKQLRERLRIAKGVISEQVDELKKVKEKPVEETQQAPIATSNADPQQQSAYYVATLQTRAMQNMGNTDLSDPLVKMEIQRLYASDMEMAQKQTTAAKDAEEVLERTLSSFPQLGDEDKEAIKEQLATQDVLARADEDFVRSSVHTYMGANFDKFAKAPKESKPNSAPGAAAISSKKAKGSGVELGQTGLEGGENVPPATPEELKGMKRLSMPPDQIALYRKAKLKKHKYEQQ